MAMRTRLSSERGFTIVELMIASLITMLVMGVAFTTFDNALQLNDATIAQADSTQNLRVGTNLLVRDLMQAGREIPIGGISIPSGNTQPLPRPSPPNMSYTFDNTTASALQAITTGNGLGPVVAGKATDLITILMVDPFLDGFIVCPSGTAPSAAAPCNAPSGRLAADGSTFDVRANTAWLQGNPDEGISPVVVGDLMWFASGSGNTIQTVTAVSGSTVTFAANDPFKFNQRNALSGSITQMLNTIMTVKRLQMYTYYVYADTAGEPRLQRVLNHFPKTPLAGVIEDLDLSYDLVDGVNNPVEVENLPFTAYGNTYSASQIRKVNVHVGVRSERMSPRTKDYLRHHVSTVISIRSLAYVDRYR